MIMVMDTEKKRIDVLRRIELPTYYMNNINKDEVRQLIGFLKQEEGWIVHTYVPEAWKDDERYELELNIRTNKYKSSTHKGQGAIAVFLYHDKKNNAWVWKRYEELK